MNSAVFPWIVSWSQIQPCLILFPGKLVIPNYLSLWQFNCLKTFLSLLYIAFDLMKQINPPEINSRKYGTCIMPLWTVTASIIWAISLCKKKASGNVQFYIVTTWETPGNHWCWWPNTLIIAEGDNQSGRSSAPVVSRCFPGGYNVKLYISRGRLAWWLLAFLCCVQRSSNNNILTQMAILEYECMAVVSRVWVIIMMH